MTDWKVPLFDLEVGEEEYKGLKDVLDSKWLTMGQVTKDFEAAFADYLGMKHSIAVNSGTAALHIAHHALGLEAGHEVICPSLTFVASSNTILYTGAKPVFADVTGLNDLTISPDDIESNISERTKGIVAVHYAGFPCNMDRIMDIAQKHGLYVVEDAAHAPGAEYIRSKLRTESLKGENRGSGFRVQGSGELTVNDDRRTAPASPRKVGTIGDIGCFSFFGNKNMTTAEGGMVVTNRDDLADKVKIARSHGMTRLTWDRYKGDDFSYDVLEAGFNYRIDELRSSLGLVQLRKLAKNNERRRLLWALYQGELNGIEEIRVPFSGESANWSHHIFPVLLSGKINRQSFMTYLQERGIQTSIHYPPVHLFSFYRRSFPGDRNLPFTEDVGKREVTLPLFPAMREEQVSYVVACVKDYLSNQM